MIYLATTSKSCLADELRVCFETDQILSFHTRIVQAEFFIDRQYLNYFEIFKPKDFKILNSIIKKHITSQTVMEDVVYSELSYIETIKRTIKTHDYEKIKRLIHNIVYEGKKDEAGINRRYGEPALYTSGKCREFPEPDQSPYFLYHWR